MTKRSRAFASAGGMVSGLAIILAACQVLVPSTVPDFQCTGGDSTSCPAGLVCDTATSKCVATISQGEGGPPPDVQNPEAGPSISGLGGPCAKDPDCKPGLFCGNSTILNIKTDPACTKACCTSNDCDPGFVCYASGTGSYCVAGKLVDRHPPQTGGAPPGASCTSDEECRSGQCFNGQRCLDTCCHDSACTNGTICGVPSGGVGGHAAWACIVPNGGGLGLQQTCTNPPECANGACETGVIPDKRCTAPCCSAADCSAAGFVNNACSYATPQANDQLRFCVEKSNDSTKAEGAGCGSDNDCATRFCDFNTRVCLRACCTSADCNAGESCRPSDGTIRLRCVKST